MLLSASLVPITIVTEDCDKAVILTEALKGQAQSYALQLQSSMRLFRILIISDLNLLMASAWACPRITHDQRPVAHVVEVPTSPEEEENETRLYI